MGFIFIVKLIGSKFYFFKKINIDTYPSQLLIYPHINVVVILGTII